MIKMKSSIEGREHHTKLRRRCQLTGGQDCLVRGCQELKSTAGTPVTIAILRAARMVHDVWYGLPRRGKILRKTHWTNGSGDEEHNQQHHQGGGGESRKRRSLSVQHRRYCRIACMASATEGP
jgi:hypothetical protein